ncbi:hypothetical protein KQI65_14725 [bacterium]|nr:hypothetical protein [bacterium]
MSLTKLEQTSIDAFRNGTLPGKQQAESDDEPLRFGLWALLTSAQIVREYRMGVADLERSVKADGSMVTSIEKEIEYRVLEALRAAMPDVQFVGEELGNSLPEKGVALAMDPIDGTWSFLAHAESCTTTLTWYQDTEPTLGMVVNHATGELAYAAKGGLTRLLQLSLFGEADMGMNLTPRRQHDDTCLINVHPSRSADAIVQALYTEWKQNAVRSVRSLGGSPVWSMLDAAKGHYLYVNNWAGGPAQSFDLAAGILLVRGAGGDAVDVQGKSIDMLGHTGLFIAGGKGHCMHRLLELLSKID